MSISAQLPPIPLSQSGPTLHALAPLSGQTIVARVIAQTPDGMAQLQFGRQTLSLQLPPGAAPGTVLTLAIKQAEGQVQLSLVATRAPPGQGPTPPPAASVNPAATSVQLSASALASAASAPVAVVTARAAAPMTATGAPVTQPAGTQAAPLATSTAASGSPPVGVVPVAAATVTPTPVRQAIPYAAAPAAAPIGQGVAPVQPLEARGAGGGETMRATPGTSPPSHVLSSGTPSLPSETKSALTQMVQQALPRQDSIASLMRMLTVVAGQTAIPQPVLKAARQVLGQSLSLDGARPDGAALQKAVALSGVFQEALLASGKGALAGGDLKTALLGLHQKLGAWLGPQAPLEAAHAMPPPVRGQAPRARTAELPLPDLPDDAVETGKLLLERTEAALSRLRLHQNASLPEPSTRHEPQWSLDLPVTIAGQPHVLHMQIHGDPKDAEADPGERGWQVRFAINLGEPGEVGAQISLRGEIAGVMLWAEDERTAAALSESIEALRADLETVDLTPGALVVRSGAPAAMVPQSSSGHLVDAVR